MWDVHSVVHHKLQVLGQNRTKSTTPKCILVHEPTALAQLTQMQMFDWGRFGWADEIVNSLTSTATSL